MIAGGGTQELNSHMSKRKYVDVTVSWCYGDCRPTAKIPLADWDEVLKGNPVDASTTYGYEGKRYHAYFAFNYEGRGSLKVTYDDGGEGFIGDISDAEIVGGTFE
jgi:hypothetical protein